MRLTGVNVYSADGRIGDDVSNAATAVLTGDRRWRVAAGLAKLGGHLHDQDQLPGADVERLGPDRLRCDGGHVGGGDVVDMDEIAHLPTVIEDPWYVA